MIKLITNSNLYLLLLLPFIFACQPSQKASENDPDAEEWIALFDGSNMDNWIPKVRGYEMGVNYKDRWLVEDSLLSVRYAPEDTFKGDFGHLYYDQKFSHYRLRATYRFVGEQMTDGPGWAVRNNGLMLHCQDPRDIGFDQDFPISLEMQLLGGDGTNPRTTGNLCTPGTNVVLDGVFTTDHCINSTSETYHGDQWVEAEVLVYGDSLFQHFIEGQLVLQYTDATVGGGAVSGLKEGQYNEGEALGEGFISIQAETAPIDFKKIEVLDLCGCMDEKAKNYKSYYVKADNSRCVY